LKAKGLIIAVVVCAVFSYLLSTVQEQAREAFENGDYCESQRRLKWTALVSKEGKLMLGSLYAGGFCVSQDIARARGYYASVYGNEPAKIGEALFYDALEAAASDERNGKKMRPQELRALFIEAKSLGFRPTEKDFAKFSQKKLGRDFFDWGPSK
jgi:hypothetical protein